MSGGGLGGAASGASDMVDDGDAAMHSGTAASDRKVKKDSFCGPRPGVCAQVCVHRCVSVRVFSSAASAQVFPEETNSHRTT